MLVLSFGLVTSFGGNEITNNQPEPPKEVAQPVKQYSVTATVMTSETGGSKLADGRRNDADDRVFCALPSKSALGAVVTIYCPETGKTATDVPVCDVGPHSIADPYWKKDTRPLAEAGKSDKYGKAKNKAGIDLSLKLCNYLGLKYPYKGKVTWWFEHSES